MIKLKNNYIKLISWLNIIQGHLVSKMKELSKKEVKLIRKLMKHGTDVPEICQKFGIPPEEWRDVALKYELF